MWFAFVERHHLDAGAGAKLVVVLVRPKYFGTRLTFVLSAFFGHTLVIILLNNNHLRCEIGCFYEGD